MTQSDISALISALNYFHPLSPGMEKYLQKHTQQRTCRKGKLLLKAGAPCNHVYFIREGAVRGFIKEGQRDITTWITVENQVVTSISAVEGVGPSIENMQAIESCELLALSYDDLQKLYQLFPDFNIVVRKLLQQYYRDAEGRAFIARLTNAENKYRRFLITHDQLANRIPLKYIASFLGLSQETVSRVRKKISLAGR